eukprot:341241_1
MTEVSNFSEAWDAFVGQHDKPPKDANQLHKYSKLNKAVTEITYPLARLQYDFHSKVVQAAKNEVSGDSNSISDELKRLKNEQSKHYVELWDRGFFEFGKIHRDKTGMKFMQFNVCLDTLLGKQKPKSPKNEDEKSEEKELQISPEQWQFRGYRIIEIIAKYEPDIVTIQELNHFQFMSHYLKPLGYEGVLKLNTKSKLLEGVAVFYNAAQYEKVTTFMYGKDVEKGTGFDLFALSVVLTHKKTNREIVVCSANLDAKDKKPSRMVKLMHLMASLNDISTNYNGAPIFIGCDLGTDASSEEYDSIQHGRLFLKDNDNVPKGYEEGYGLKLSSAYYPSFYKGKTRSSEPKCTVFGGTCRDYIFIDEAKGVSSSNVLQLPTEKEMQQHKKYPNWQSPSSHFALMAQLFF